MTVLDNQSPDLFGPTPWQTLGPFFHYALPWKGCADLTGPGELGARPDLIPPAHDMLHRAVSHPTPVGPIIEIFGRVLDAAGDGVPDAMVEIWQADAAGRYVPTDGANDAFPGFGRCATDAGGGYRFRTVRPGVVPQPDGHLSAPHIAVNVLGRGLLKRLVTRLYFPDDPGNARDTVLGLVPEARRVTLLAQKAAGGYRFDIVLQGDNETVFFQC